MPKGKRIEPLDLEELENNPSLNGMLAFRDTIKVNPLPRGLPPIGAPPTPLAPIELKPVRPVTDPLLSDVLAHLADIPRPPKSRGKIMRAARVEDGHSATQDALYWYLWRVGKQVNGSRSRFVQAGYGQIQAGLGVDRSNVQDAIRELQKKFSVRILKSSTVGSATVYEIFSCEDILARRRSEGLLWVRKFGTRRSDLLTSAEDDATPIGAKPIGAAPIGLAPSVGVIPTDPIGFTPTPPIGVAPIHSVKEEANSKTTSPLAVIIRVVHEELGDIDNPAARRILASCYDRAPDATIEEIEHLIRLQALRVRNSKRVENPIGLLIAQIPKCFEGESFRLWRQRRERARGREVEDVGDINRYQAVLDDPNASEREKSVALAALAKA